MHGGTRISTAMRLAGLAVSTVLLAAACSGALPAASTGGGGGSGAPAGTKHIPIVNKDLTDDQIKAEVAKEGSLVVGNWTYTANDELKKQFIKYVKDTYGADIQFTYEGTQQPSTYLTKLAAAKQGGNPAPYDVIAVEENYWADATTNDLVDSFLPSPLVPNESLVLDIFKHSCDDRLPSPPPRRPSAVASGLDCVAGARPLRLRAAAPPCRRPAASGRRLFRARGRARQDYARGPDVAGVVAWAIPHSASPSSVPLDSAGCALPGLGPLWSVLELSPRLERVGGNRCGAARGGWGLPCHGYQGSEKAAPPTFGSILPAAFHPGSHLGLCKAKLHSILGLSNELDSLRAIFFGRVHRLPPGPFTASFPHLIRCSIVPRLFGCRPPPCLRKSRLLF